MTPATFKAWRKRHPGQVGHSRRKTMFYNESDKAAWTEYDMLAEHFARKNVIPTGPFHIGQHLPTNASKRAVDLINDDVEAFVQRVKDCAYARAMNALNLPEE